LVVGETAMRVTREGNASTVALIINPNPSRVTATRMNMDLFDDNGGLVTTSSATVTVLPWQTTAVTASVDGAEGAKVLAVTLSKSSSEWEGFEGPTGELTFSEVRTRQKDGFSTTTGRIQSSLESRWDLVSVTAVYRNRSGRIIGYATGNVDSIPPKGRASFRIEGFEKLPKIAATEMYYQP
jgi:hypothetical protein